MGWTDMFCTCFLFLYLNSWVERSSRWRLERRLERSSTTAFWDEWKSADLWTGNEQLVISSYGNHFCPCYYKLQVGAEPSLGPTSGASTPPCPSSDGAPLCGLWNPQEQMHVANRVHTPRPPTSRPDLGYVGNWHFYPHCPEHTCRACVGQLFWGGLQCSCVYLQAKGKPAVGGEVLGRVWLLGLEYLHSYA